MAVTIGQQGAGKENLSGSHEEHTKASSLHQFAIAVCAVLLTVAAPAWAEKFTVAVVPDTQNDKTYYPQVGFYEQYRYGAPRNFTISANYHF